MKMNRRKAVKLGGAATIGAMLTRSAMAATDKTSEFEAAFQDTLARLRNAFADMGFAEMQPLSVVTGQGDYNGGLRHDFDQSVLPDSAFVIQPLARVGDVAEQKRQDVLPLFHEVGCHPSAGSDGQKTTRMMVDLLINDFGLDPKRLAFVSVPQSKGVQTVLNEMGLPFTEKVLLRDEAKALAARDASGFFFPDPFGDDYLVTMGVYYRVGDADESAPTAYPPSANWTEIGEIIIAGDVAPLGLSIGAERLTLALTGLYSLWDQRLEPLYELVESQSNGTPPSGLAAFR